MQDTSNHSDQDEISLVDIATFLIENVKLFLFGGLLGGLVALGFVSVKGQYTAELVLLNQGSGFNFMNWNSTQKNIVTLAQEVVITEKQVPEIVKLMASPEWWKNAVQPTYSLTKSEIKNLVSISKDVQESEATRILSIVFKINGDSSIKAKEHVDEVVDFVRKAAEYISVKSLVIGYESTVTREALRIDLELKQAELDMKVLHDRRDYLYELRKQFPNESGTPQIVDLKDGTAKFLPITTQLVAVLTDINAFDENVLRLKREKSKLDILREFVMQGQTVLNVPFKSIPTVNPLLGIEQNIREKTSTDDLPKVIALDNIRSSLIGIQTAYSLGLPQLAPPFVRPPKYFKPLGLGVVGGVFAGFLLSLLLVAWRLVKPRIRQPGKA